LRIESDLRKAHPKFQVPSSKFQGPRATFRISDFKPQAFEGSGCRAAAARAHCSAPVRQKLELRHGAKNLFAPAARKREPLHHATINELLATDYRLFVRKIISPPVVFADSNESCFDFRCEGIQSGTKSL
jgi:hypothetical protein